MRVQIPDACDDCWQGKLNEVKESPVATLCPFLARVALPEKLVPPKMDALIATQAEACRGIGGTTVAQVVEGPRRSSMLRTMRRKLIPA